MKPRAIRVLIIDDHPEYRQLLIHHIITEWSDAEIDELDPRVENAALFGVDGEGYDVVLLDYQLGRYSGLQLLRQFKENPNFPPIIFMTAYGDERLAAAAIKFGADDYLPKASINNKVLVTTIRECLRANQAPNASVSLPDRIKAFGRSVVGIQIKGYDVIEKIAMGSSSVVYLAYSHVRQEKVVLKVLYGSFELSDEYEVLERFLIEYQSISAVSHANVVGIYDVGVADDHAFIAMEYIRGGSLRTRLRERGTFEGPEGIEIIKQITHALAAIHEVGILHRDLKPGNVMFRANGDLCIIDFGLAKQVQIEQDITLPGKIYGTPYYMSPEQSQGLDIDERSDFYSLGVVLFELFTGKKPYVAGTPVALLYKHAHAAIPELPETLKRYQPLINTLLAKEPANRPSSLKKLMAVLNQYERL